ncbi:MAG: hypothetical protein QF579_00435, partial [Dehalococcoidia bacterium]|nr:hypothetical protein [Dehalococcoidia bacterium]
PSQNRTPHDTADVGWVLFGNRNHEFTVDQYILAPGINVAVDWFLQVRGTGRRDGKTPCDRVAGNPSNDSVISFFDVGHALAHMSYNPGPFVPQDQGACEVGVLHLVKLRMADSTGIQFDYYLVCPWVRQYHFAYSKLLSGGSLDRCNCFHDGVPPTRLSTSETPIVQ